ncbi:UDP-glucose 4-epimerase GalE [Lactobacillus psittaci]|uniref:UDP-glucose 4-epimerase n=1 Tax=Lactobacillus psittaci DSM 15354 TaxID=1122152 RepID=A0A0R1S392_9LACO|nr:UDP-glucose 4-epimerase GalE [Lactobacillus psittaci]KRL63006.1 UDP-glucose 4-epimerase [Lactobacillus psittaci DSM 15354]
MRVLVTGGAGYIGSHTVLKLIEDGNEVVVLDNLVTGHKEAVNPQAKFYEGSVLDTNLVYDILTKEKIDAVIHFAAYLLVGESVEQPLKYYHNNVTGMINLLEAMQKANVKTLVFSSSAATYGVPEKLPLTEKSPTNPINPYGETKLMMEKIMRWTDSAYGIKSIALRYFNVAGASLDASIGEDHAPETHLVPNILLSAEKGDGKFTIFGDDYNTPDGTNVRDYVHVVDLASAHVLALHYLGKNRQSEIFNLGSAHGFSNLEILKSAIKVTGIDIPYTMGPRRPGDPDSLVADSTKARTILGWKPKYDNIDDIIASAWKFVQTHPHGYQN